MSRILVIGATSAIAEACARLYALRGDKLILVARDPERLKAITDDLRLRGAAQVDFECMDVNDLLTHEPLIDRVFSDPCSLDTVLIAHGSLPDQAETQASVSLTLQQLQTNALSTIALLTLLAMRFERQGHGCLAVISSVAGERGRASNYIYGTAKAALDCFCSGLRQRLRSSGVNVLTIKPGFVDTPMTRHFRKGMLWTKPQQVAAGIVQAIDKRRHMVYLPGFWAWIMFVIRHLPETIFLRLRL